MNFSYVNPSNSTDKVPVPKLVHCKTAVVQITLNQPCNNHTKICRFLVSRVKDLFQVLLATVGNFEYARYLLPKYCNRVSTVPSCDDAMRQAASKMG